jgi:uncharacterized protein (TIGR02246 family)
MKRLILVLSCATLFAVGCATARTGGFDPGSAAEITAGLHASAEAWNSGDFDGFMEPYLDSPGTTFVGSTGLMRGKDAIEQRYRASYWSEGTPGQTLHFVDIEVQPLGSDHALLLGRYNVHDRDGTLAAEGPFSLVYTRTSDGWRIIHDHSS